MNDSPNKVAIKKLLQAISWASDHPEDEASADILAEEYGLSVATVRRKLLARKWPLGDR